MLFHLKADAYFEADSIGEAMDKLAQHLSSAQPDPFPNLIEQGYININPAVSIHDESDD